MADGQALKEKSFFRDETLLEFAQAQIKRKRMFTQQIPCKWMQAISEHRFAALVIDESISDGAIQQAKYVMGMTLLHYVAMEGGKQDSIFLLERGADVTAKLTDGATPIHLAASSNNVGVLQAIKQYVHWGVLQAQNIDEQSPLLCALRAESYEAALWWLDEVPTALDQIEKALRWLHFMQQTTMRHTVDEVPGQYVGQKRTRAQTEPSKCELLHARLMHCLDLAQRQDKQNSQVVALGMSHRLRSVNAGRSGA